MSNSWKVVFAVLATVIIVGGCGYYYMNNKATKEKNDLQAMIDDLNVRVDDLTASSEVASTGTVVTTGSTATTGTAVSSWKNYTNTKYGFSLTFNDLWKNYQVIEVKADDSTALSYLYVCVPTTSTIWSEKNAEKGLFCPFAIDVVAKANKTAFESANEPLIPTFITSNSSYVYYWSSAQDAPTDGRTIFADSKNIIATFKAN